MKFKYDIFLSYNIDDFDEFDAKWLNEFKKNLFFFTSQVLGREIVLIDSSIHDSLEGNVYAETMVFVPVLTENYSENENSYHEFNTFINSNSELEVNSLPRVIKVLKNPQDYTPSKILDYFDFKFFEYNQRTGETLSLSIENGESYQSKYWLKLMDLAYHIADIDKGLNLDEEDRKAVYLALTTSDQTNSRDVLKRELERHGLKVYPNHTLDLNSEGLEEEIQKQLRNSMLSIHILGEQYGDTVKDSKESLVVFQNRVSAQYAKTRAKMDSSFKRILWVAPASVMMEEEQEIFLDELSHNKEMIFGGEIIKTPIESLKSIISDKIDLLRLHENKADYRTNVYLMADINDFEKSESLLSELKLEGFSTFRPNYDLGQHELMVSNRCYLAQSDVPVIYYGHINEYWLRMKLMDLSKAPGFGRPAPIEKKIIFNDTGSLIVDPFILNSAVIFDGNKKELFELIGSEIRNNWKWKQRLLKILNQKMKRILIRFQDYVHLVLMKVTCFLVEKAKVMKFLKN